MVTSSLVAGAEMMTFLAPPSMCAVRLGGVGEEAGRLDDDVGAEVAPRQGGRVALGEDLDGLVADRDARRRSTDTSSASRPRIESYLSRWARVLLSVEVVDGDDLDVGAGRRHGAEEVAADAAEAVDAYANSHGVLPSSSCGACRRSRHLGMPPTLDRSPSGA